MDTQTQQLIIKILGFLATLSLIETLLLITYTTAPETITTQIILITSNIIGLLGGFIAGKTLTEKQQETLNTTPITPITDQEIQQIIEDLENTNNTKQEVTPNAQHNQKKHNTRKQ